jgi:hypothetical protein
MEDEVIKMEVVNPHAAAPMIERFKNDPVFHDLIDQIQNTHEKDN